MVKLENELAAGGNEPHINDDDDDVDHQYGDVFDIILCVNLAVFLSKLQD